MVQSPSLQKIKKGVIQSLKAEHTDTPAFFDKAWEVLEDEIIQNQTADGIDTVSGATYSSNGILDAMRDIINQAKKDNSSKPTVTPKPTKTPTPKPTATPTPEPTPTPEATPTPGNHQKPRIILEKIRKLHLPRNRKNHWDHTGMVPTQPEVLDIMAKFM